MPWVMLGGAKTRLRSNFVVMGITDVHNERIVVRVFKVLGY